MLVLSSTLLFPSVDTLYYLPESTQFHTTNWSIAAEINQQHIRFILDNWLAFKVKKIQVLFNTDAVGQTISSIKFYKDTLKTLFYSFPVNSVLTTNDVYPNWYSITVPEDMPVVQGYIELPVELAEFTSICVPMDLTQYSGHTLGFDINNETWQIVNDFPIKLLVEGALIISVQDLENNLKFNLSDNYPNPFNPSTTIGYSLPYTQHVSLKVYDILGNEVAALVNESKLSGNYTVDFKAHQLSSGVYFYTLRTDNFVAVKKMLIIK